MPWNLTVRTKKKDYKDIMDQIKGDFEAQFSGQNDANEIEMSRLRDDLKLSAQTLEEFRKKLQQREKEAAIVSSQIDNGENVSLPDSIKAHAELKQQLADERGSWASEKTTFVVRRAG
jgi:hypothetical protein